MDWNKLLEEHGHALLLYARQWTKNSSDAEEVLQNGLIRFWKAWLKKSDVIQSPLPYLYTTIKRSALDYLRSHKRRIKREDQASELLYTKESLFIENYDKENIQQLLEFSLEDLPREQREVLVMKIWGKLTFKQISRSLDISINTASSRYRYALESLKTTLAKKGVEL